jgi:hypothetical protein
LTYINIQTLQSILDQLFPGAKAYGQPGGDLRAALCGNDILYVWRGLLNDISRSHAGFFEHALGEPALYPILVAAAVNTSFLELQVAQERAIAEMREQPRLEDEHNEDAPEPPPAERGYEEDDEWEL